MLSVYPILALATKDESSPGVGKAIPLTLPDASLNGPTMDAYQIRLWTYGNWLYGMASLPSRPHSRYCANPWALGQTQHHPLGTSFTLLPRIESAITYPLNPTRILTRLSLTNATYALRNISSPQLQLPCPLMLNALLLRNTATLCHGSTILPYSICPILSIMDLIHDNDRWAIHTLH
jgi:hypothetical protein